MSRSRPLSRPPPAGPVLCCDHHRPAGFCFRRNNCRQVGLRVQRGNLWLAGLVLRRDYLRLAGLVLCCNHTRPAQPRPPTAGPSRLMAQPLSARRRRPSTDADDRPLPLAPAAVASAALALLLRELTLLAAPSGAGHPDHALTDPSSPSATSPMAVGPGATRPDVASRQLSQRDDHAAARPSH